MLDGADAGGARSVGAPAARRISTMARSISGRSLALAVAVGMVMADGALRPVAFDGTLKRLDRLVDEPTVHLQSAIGINTDGVIAGDVDWQGAEIGRAHV